MVKDSKKKNPLDLSGKSPFVYNSSESEDEEPSKEVTKMETDVMQPVEIKTVWKENLFFSKLDNRLQGLYFVIIISSKYLASFKIINYHTMHTCYFYCL